MTRHQRGRKKKAPLRRRASIVSVGVVRMSMSIVRMSIVRMSIVRMSIVRMSIVSASFDAPALDSATSAHTCCCCSCSPCLTLFRSPPLPIRTLARRRPSFLFS